MLKKSSMKVAISMVCLLLAAFSLLVYIERDKLGENPFSTTRTFENLSHAVTAQDGSMLVIDSGKSRVSVLRDNQVAATIIGKKESKGFFYAEHIASSGEKIFVADVTFIEGGVRVKSERITQFNSDGRFEKVLYERSYTDEMPLQYGNILDMRYYDGVLTFLMRNEDSLELYSIVQGIPSFIRTVSYGDAEYLFHAMYDAASDKVCAVTRRGLICLESEPGYLSAAYDFSQTGSVPWALEADSGGNLYVLDIRAGSITLADGTPAYAAEDIVYRFSIGESDVISYTSGESVYQMRADGRVLFSGSAAPYETTYFALRLIIWILCAVVCLALLYATVRLIMWLMRNSKTSQSKFMAMIIVSTILTSTIVAVNILGNSIETSSEKTRYNLTQIALSVSNLSRQAIGDDLEAVNVLGDYGGPAFTRIHEALDPICDSALEQGSNMYYILYKYVDDMLYAFLDYEEYTGILCPAGDFLGPPTRELAAGTIPYVFESGSDAYGSWTLAVAPIYNSGGEIVGLIEIGSNLDVETIRTRNQVEEIVVSTAVLLVLFLLAFSEVSVIMDNLSRHKTKPQTEEIPGLIRTLVFLAFLADCSCAAFIPQLSARIFHSSGLTFSPSIGAALPLSAELLFTATIAIIGGMLIDRFGMKRVLLGGVFVEMLGLIITAAAVATSSYGLLLLGSCVTGSGLGAVVVSGNTLPLYYEDRALRNELYSGVNVGIMASFVVGVTLGSYASRAVGYAATFILSAVILLPALYISLKCAPSAMASIKDREESVLPGSPEDAAGGAKGKTPLLRFLTSRSVFSFMLFIMLPFLIILNFKDYVFPLFASESGYSDVDIGNALLFSGAIAIFLVPPVADAVLKRFHTKVIIIAVGVLFATGLLMFTIWPTSHVSIATVYIISIVGCFGTVVQGVYFSGLRASVAFGAGKSMGVFSLFQNLCLAIGPLVFGALLVFGYQISTLIMSLAFFILIVLFAILSPRDVPPEPVEQGARDIREKLPGNSLSSL